MNAPVSSSAPARDPARLEHLRRLARLMDARWRIPILGKRFGLDAVIGLIPGLGDVAASGVSLWIVWSAARMGAPRPTVLRMIGNIGIDLLVGAIPVLGDVFDVAFKANKRNLQLLEKKLGLGLDLEGRDRRAAEFDTGHPEISEPDPRFNLHPSHGG